MPPRHVDLHLHIATDGKDRCVSRQARRAGHEALSAGLSYLLPCFCALWVGSFAMRKVAMRGAGGMRGQGVVAGAGCSWTALFQGTRWRLCGRTIPGKSWGGLLYIDNGGCSLEPWWRARSGGVRRREAVLSLPPCLAMPCARSVRRCDPALPRGPWAEPGENSSFVALARVWHVALASLQALPSKALCYPLDPCFHFFPAAKCPTHLK